MIPLATTTVTVAAATRTEPDEPSTYGTPTGPHRAHIAAPQGSLATGGAGAERIDAVLYVDADVTVAQGAQVIDQGTGLPYEVAWSAPRQGLGLAHVQAGLLLVRGAVPA